MKKTSFSKLQQEKHESHHQLFAWAYFALMALAVWLVSAPWVFGYQQPLMVRNDLLCGILLLYFSYRSLNPYNLFAQWMVVFVGLWLFMAPIFFWAEDSIAFLNNNLLAVFVVFLGIIIPGQPGLMLFRQEGMNVPPGWSYNPSSWMERAPVVALAWLGYLAAQYLAAFQLGYIDDAWDPFFGNGTIKVLTSDVSKAFPVSDAALGAFAYILDVLMGLVGGTHRWRTMPWVVAIFGILIVPLGAVSITLIILQPVAVGYWCSICLFTAFVSLLMIPFAVDEVLASAQLLKDEVRRGKSFWRVFWFGGTTVGVENEPGPKPQLLFKCTGREIMRDLLNKPWNLFAGLAIGGFVMMAPFYFNFSEGMSNNCFISGALAITFTVAAMSEVLRMARFINLLLGGWLAVSPWLLGPLQTEALIFGALSGIFLALLSFPKGKIVDKRGSYNRYIF